MSGRQGCFSIKRKQKTCTGKEKTDFINSIDDAATPRCPIMDCKQRLGERQARKVASIIFSSGLAGKGIGGGELGAPFLHLISSRVN